MSYEFPKDFVWGVAAASAQIEGAAWEDGKGESVWDRFSRRPGATRNGDTPDVACNHYHLYEQDAEMMAALGFKNYRLSIAWPRILPDGTGAVNEKGLGFYDRLIDALLARGITPWTTYYHWDLPQKLEDENGWLNRKTVDAFARYAEIVTRRLGDRVKNWFTLNEMPCFIGLSYQQGIHAPGRREPLKQVNQAYHHALLCHGHAVRCAREFGGPGTRVGLVHNPDVPLPVIETPEHIAAARDRYERLNGQLLGPIFRGEYPAWWLEEAGANAPVVQDEDFSLIHEPGDFLGLNVYCGKFVRAGNPPAEVPFPKGSWQGDLPWLNITPQTIYWVVRYTQELFGAQPFYITENGCAFKDTVTSNGEILDLDRREFLRNYFISMHRTISEGYDVRGYFEWSIMDNFEWAEGYEKRFGIVHVDYATQKRTPKLSAQWYSAVVRENRVL